MSKTHPRDQALAAAYRIKRGKKRGGRVGYDDGGPVNFEDRWAGASDPFTTQSADATDDFGARWGDMPSNTVRREEANPGRAMRQMLATQGFNQRLGDVAGEKAAGMANLYQTFGDTLQGKYTPQPADPRVWTEQDQEARNRGADQLARRAPFLALDTMWAASPFAKEPNSLGIFGGRLAKTADHAKLAQAEEMAARGVDRDEIWKTTGWGQGADNKWRFEIPDNNAFLKGTSSPGVVADRTGNTVGGGFYHPDLYAAYPAIGDVGLRGKQGAGGLRGEYSRGDILDPDGKPEIRLQNALGARKADSVMLHEVQHALQDAEGLAQGTSIDALYLNPNVPKFKLAADEAKARGLDWDALSKADRKELTNQVLNDIYERHAGEVEARNVQARKDMTPEERLASPPWTTEDIPRDQQIVRFNSDGPQASVGTPPQPTWYHGTNKNFDKFDLNAVRATGEPDIAVHLSSSRPLAGGYAGNNGRVIEANTGFKNPKIIEKETWGGRSANAQEIERAKAEGHDGIIYRYTGDHSYIDPANPHPQEAVAWAPGTILDTKTASDLLIPPQQGIRAYHGSPYDFDRFDMSKIGSGEGAQSYGHGLYFAGNEGTADFYRKALAPKGADDIGQMAHHTLLTHGGNAERAAAELRQRAATESKDPFSGIPPQTMLDAAQMIERGIAPKGRMYEVNINARPEQFLDWDKPLTGQRIPSDLRGALDRSIAEEYTTLNDPSLATGEDLYSALRDRAINWQAGNHQVPLGAERSRASEYLRDAGIPGIKYLDQGSRVPQILLNGQAIPKGNAAAQAAAGALNVAGDTSAAIKALRDAPNIYGHDNTKAAIQLLQEGKVTKSGDATSNYVLFDDKIIDILRKYGLAGLTAAPALAGAAMKDRDQNRGFAGGGSVPWYSRAEARGLEHAGFIHSPVAGRTDKLPLSVKSQSYVLPADIVSALGDGNSLAGANGLNKMFRLGPYGSQSSPLKMGSARPIRQRFASGGAVGVPTDIVAAGGEYSIPPETIAEIGGGDVQRGQDLLDTMVRQVRRKAIQTLKHLPGPKSK